MLEFVPEDVCPLAAQMLVDATRLDFKSNESPEEVIAPDFKIFQYP